MKIAVIGCGHMGCALLAGLLKSGISDAHLIPIDPDERVRAQLEQRLKLHCGSAPDAGLRAVQALILSVKPDILADVARQIAPYLQTQLVISVAAVIRALCARCRIFPLLLVLASRGWPRCPVCGRQIALVQSVSCRASAKSSGAWTKTSRMP